MWKLRCILTCLMRHGLGYVEVELHLDVSDETRAGIGGS
jgi:hypothetical protein